MNKLEGARLRTTLEQTDARLEHHLRTLGEAQQFLAKAVAGKPFLLVDASLGRAAQALERTTEQLRQLDSGWAQLVELYINKLFGGTLPTDTVDIFRSFLGPNVEVVRSDPRNPVTVDDRFSAVGFTGSAANVTFGLDELLRDQSVPGMTGITHGSMLKMNGELYRAAAKAGLPVMGLCYGHQRIGIERGGTIARNDHTKGFGMVSVEPSNYATDLLVGAISQPVSLSGEVPAYHDEALIESGPQSAVIMRTSDEEPGKIYGMIHVAEGQFTGDAHTDADLLKARLAHGDHVAVTTQWHPEFEGFMPFIEFSATQDPAVFEKDYAPGMAASLLAIMAGVIEQHNNR